jgi:hypothetical protein
MMFYMANIDIPMSMPTETMQNKIVLQKRQLGIALLLLAVSIFALQPNITLADQPNSKGTLSISATGQAYGIGKNKGQTSTATLNLAGQAQGQGNKQLSLYALTGILLIGSTNYTFTNGHGESNNPGSTEIEANTKGGNNKLELDLHGSINGSNVTFTQPQSKLSSLYFLSLTGQVTLNLQTFTTTSKSYTKSFTHTETDDEHQHKNQTTTITQNQTIFQTITQTVNNTQTVTQGNNQTITVTVTQNNTPTVTETVTQSATNSTVTVTTTTTVANTTITTT